MLNKQQRNILKREIIKELTEGSHRLYDKQEGYAIYSGTNMQMVMECVFRGLNKHTEKAEAFKECILNGAGKVLSEDNIYNGKEVSGKKLEGK